MSCGPGSTSSSSAGWRFAANATLPPDASQLPLGHADRGDFFAAAPQALIIARKVDRPGACSTSGLMLLLTTRLAADQHNRARAAAFDLKLIMRIAKFWRLPASVHSVFWQPSRTRLRLGVRWAFRSAEGTHRRIHPLQDPALDRSRRLRGRSRLRRHRLDTIDLCDRPQRRHAQETVRAAELRASRNYRADGIQVSAVLRLRRRVAVSRSRHRWWLSLVRITAAAS